LQWTILAVARGNRHPVTVRDGRSLCCGFERKTAGRKRGGRTKEGSLHCPLGLRLAATIQGAQGLGKSRNKRADFAHPSPSTYTISSPRFHYQLHFNSTRANSQDAFAATSLPLGRFCRFGMKFKRQPFFVRHHVGLSYRGMHPSLGTNFDLQFGPFSPRPTSQLQR